MNFPEASSYIHPDSIGNLFQCEQNLLTTEPELERLYDAEEILGYQLVVIENREDAAENLVNLRVFDLIKDTYPVVYARLQAKENNTIEIDRFMAGLNFIRV
jgi:protein tyrosine/serine phosphatase